MSSKSLKSTTPNSKEETMTNQPSLIQQVFQQYLEAGGKPQITSFRTHLEYLMKTEIKSLCSSSRRTSSGGLAPWRLELQSRFSGRGSKWVFVSIDEIEPTLQRLEAEGQDASRYRSHINRHGKAWIRYQKPKLLNGQPAASFTVLLLDCTIPQEQNCHLIPLDRLDEVILDTLGTTPHALKLEEEVEEVIQQKDDASKETKKKRSRKKKDEPKDLNLDDLI